MTCRQELSTATLESERERVCGEACHILQLT